MKLRQYYVYMMTNFRNTVIYTGVTNNIVRRVYEHKNKLIKSFTNKYNVIKLVYFEIFDGIETAISREKQIKAGSRKKKIDLITKDNPKFLDLYDKIIK
ncbi:GIY-YIG nuclease family protein [Patescibacteria group bacterium]|nr:GIY-YIG nuclease family protein [Patescibacteria group bacterium]